MVQNALLHSSHNVTPYYISKAIGKYHIIVSYLMDSVHSSVAC